MNWKEIKAKCKGHTPGPWKISTMKSVSSGKITFRLLMNNYVLEWMRWPCFEETVANSFLIIAAPDLLSECERLDSEVEALKAENKRLADEVSLLRSRIGDVVSEYDNEIKIERYLKSDSEFRSGVYCGLQRAVNILMDDESESGHDD